MTAGLATADEIAQQAEGALAAQQAADGLRREWSTPDLAWLAFVEVAAKFGWRSPACRAFVHELAKRAARDGARCADATLPATPATRTDPAAG